MVFLFERYYYRCVLLFAIVINVLPVPAQENEPSLSSVIKTDQVSFVLKSGTYLMGPKPLVLPKGFHLSGQGKSTILKAVEGTEIALVLSSDCQLSDLKIIASKAVKGSYSDPLVKLKPRARDITVQRVGFKNVPRVCLVMDKNENILIQDCMFEQIAMAMNIQFSHHVSVLNNTVRDAKLHGMQFWGNWNWQKQDASYIRFIGNTVINGGAGAIWGAGGKFITMNDNFIDGAKDVGLDLEWCTDATISGNTVRRCKNGGISLFFACENIAITGNSVVNDYPISEKDKKADWWVRSGIWLTYPNRKTFSDDYGHRNISIVGNTIRCLLGKRRGIWIGSEVQNVMIANNAIQNGRVWYSGHNGVNPMQLVKLPNNVLVGAIEGDDSLAAGLATVPADTAKRPVQSVSHDTVGEIINAGFEENLKGWSWNPGKAKAKGSIDTSQSLEGTSSFHIQNDAAFAPNVYSQLLQTLHGLKPQTKYKLRLWCKGKSVGGGVWFGGGKKWNIRKYLPAGTYAWSEVIVTFSTGPDETTFPFMFTIERPVTDLWIDSLNIESMRD